MILKRASMIVVLFIAYYLASQSVALNSDTVNALLQGNAIAHGNVMLNGWTLSNISFYTTDLLYYAALVWIGGFHLSILRIGSALIYAVIVMLAIELSIRHKSNMYWRIGIVLLLIGLPIEDLASVAFSPMDHTNTLVFVLAAVLLSTLRRNKLISYILVPLILAFAAVGDTLTLFVGIIPIAIASFMKRDWIMAVLTVTSGIVARIIAKHIHGFTLYPTYFRFSKLSDLPHHISYAIHGILSFTGADFFAHKLNLQSMLSVVHLISTAIIIYIAYTAIKRWRELDYIGLVLIIGMVVDLCAFLFSTFPVGDSSDRYLLTFIIFGSVLVARQYEWIQLRNVKRLNLYIGLSVITLAYMVSFLGFPTPNANQGERDVINFLAEHHMTNGYGNYWDASIMTAVSNGSVTVRPLYITSSNTISEYYWESNHNWYNKPAHFIIFDDTMGFTLQRIDQDFGKPQKVYRIGKYTIADWNTNITPKLFHVPLKGGIAWG